MAMRESVATSWRISSIGNSGARSSGPTGWPVPGCSGGGGGAGRSGIMLYHWRGISDSSSVILVRSVTTASFSRTIRLTASVSLSDQGLDRGGQLGHRLLRVGEEHA